MEGTELRRGAPCWYRRADVGLSGINDAVQVQSAMYSTLKKYFSSKPYYKNVLETFNEVSLFLKFLSQSHQSPSPKVTTLKRATELKRYFYSKFYYKKVLDTFNSVFLYLIVLTIPFVQPNAEI